MDLPSGSVTLLFTDIEGSTRLLDRLGDRYVEALADQREILRSVATARAGHEVDTQGDAFFFAFASATDAVCAAAEAQRALASHSWAEGSALRVRMGIHTGEPIRTAEGYVGMDVHRAARICAVAHGQQVVVSQATALAADDLPKGLALRELGEYRLKDIPHPEPLAQLLIEGMPNEFPPLRSMHPSNIPAPQTRIIGRERESSELQWLLQQEGVRLVTITGAGGSGKTRLAIEVAAAALERYPAGAFFVPLAPLSDSENVPAAIAGALGIREPTGHGWTDAVIDHLRERSLFLILDNFEHLLPAAPIVAALLAAAPNVRILATSRTPLKVSAEHRYPLEPLPLADSTPAGSSGVQSSPAVALFLERARAADPALRVDEPDLGIVARLCARLDGLPLAIELTAAQCSSLSFQEIFARLEGGLPTWSGARDLPERQRTLTATIEWSVALLDQEERDLFDRLAVFVGGCTSETASAVGNGRDVSDLLHSLTEASLLRRRRMASGRTRFEMLETILECALRNLAGRHDEEPSRRKHAETFATLAEETIQRCQVGDLETMRRLDDEVDNFRAALRWSIEQGDPETAGRIASALTFYWWQKPRLTEGMKWLQLVRGKAEKMSAKTRANVYFGIGWFFRAGATRENVRGLLEEALELFDPDDLRSRSLTLTVLGEVLDLQDDHLAYGTQEEALTLARRLGDGFVISTAITTLVGGALKRGDFQRARLLDEEELEIARRSGADPAHEAGVLNNLGWLGLLEGDLDSAERWFEQSLSVASSAEFDAGLVRVVLSNLGLTLIQKGNLDRSASAFRESIRGMVVRDDVDVVVAAECFQGLAGIAAVTDDSERAGRLIGAAQVARASETAPSLPERWIEDHMLPKARNMLGVSAWEQALDRGRAMPLEDAFKLALEYPAKGS